MSMWQMGILRHYRTAEPEIDRVSVNRTAVCRRRWLIVHRYIGLSAGALLVLIGVTGSLLVFWQEIDAWLNPHLFRVQAAGEGRAAYRPASELLAAAQAAGPAQGRLSTIYYPRDETVAFLVTVLVPATPRASTPFDFAQYHVFVNPYTAEVIGSRLVRPAGWGGAIPRTVIGFVFALHYALGLPRMGDPLLGDTVVAVIGIVLLVSVVSGLYLWWPKSWRWDQVLTIKWHAHVRRLTYDLHKTVGVIVSPVLMGVLLSGVYLDWPQAVVGAVRLLSPVTQAREMKSIRTGQVHPIGIDAAWAICTREFPDGRWYSFTVPTTATGLYVFRKHVPLGWGIWGMRQIALDQYSGDIRHVADPLVGTGGEVFIQWQWPLHSGLVFGVLGRWIVFAVGLLCPLLFGTGYYLWWRKRRGKKRSQ